MLSASFRFYGALNDFLPVARRQATLVCSVDPSASVKDLIEALGVPHPEVDLLVVNGEPVDFAYLVREGDRVAAYPRFHQLDVQVTGRLGAPDQAEPRFVADVHLGRLAAYLRLAGFDTAYRNDYADRELVALSASEDRTLLTRDVGVLKHRLVTRGCFLRATQPRRQLVEVLSRFNLVARAVPFTRCLRCNAMLQAVAMDRIEHRLQPRTRQFYTQFSTCPVCERVYWDGSHYEHMSRLLRSALAEASAPPPDPRSPIPDPRSPIPNPQSMMPNPQPLTPNP
jgi:uncharacterized protein